MVYRSKDEQAKIIYCMRLGLNLKARSINLLGLFVQQSVSAIFSLHPSPSDCQAWAAQLGPSHTAPARAIRLFVGVINNFCNVGVLYSLYLTVIYSIQLSGAQALHHLYYCNRLTVFLISMLSYHL